MPSLLLGSRLTPHAAPAALPLCCHIPQIKLWQGAGNPWQSSSSITLGPWDELRVSYVNAWTAKAGSSGLQGSTTLELLPDRTPLDISEAITVNLPEWAFRNTGNATGV